MASAFDCCEVLALVLERYPGEGKTGLAIETAMNFKTGETRDVAVVRFRRARKGDDGKYGHGKPYADSTFAPIAFCPFCGAKDCTRNPTPEVTHGDQ